MKAEDYIEQYCKDNLKEEDWVCLEKYREAFIEMYLKEAIFIKMHSNLSEKEVSHEAIQTVNRIYEDCKKSIGF